MHDVGVVCGFMWSPAHECGHAPHTGGTHVCRCGATHTAAFEELGSE